jgi:error-prone DNA polymerase
MSEASDVGPRYAELHCTSNFSFLEGASHPEELVRRAHALGYEALAITDRGTLSGIVRAHAAAKDLAQNTAQNPPLKLIVGAALEPVDAPPLVLWAADRIGYANLCRLLTRGHMRRAEAGAAAADPRIEKAAARSGGCVVTLDDVAAHAAGLLAGAVMPPACPTERHQRHEAFGGAVSGLSAWRDVFGDRLWALAEVALEGDDDDRLAWLEQVAERAGVPLVAAGDVRYHERARLPLFDALAAVRQGNTVEAIRESLLSNGERHLHERRRIAGRFVALPTGRGTVDAYGRRFLWPAAVERSAEIAARCTFSLDELRYEYPDAIVPAGRTARDHLADLAWKGARKRYPDGVPEKVQELLRHELALIAELGYEAYFLTVFDVVRFARRRGILCQGRGSAANSCVCYCLGITSVDPARMNVLFERFVSRERKEAPDIDVDFEHHRREEVLQYIYDTYGRSRAAMTAEVISYRLRSATRDLAKALGFSLDRVEAVAAVIDVGDHVEDLPTRLAEAGLDPASDACTRLATLVGSLVGFPRHLGQHVGGMVMTRGELCELVPIQPATMEGRSIVQWNKDDLDELGILKVDCLALGMLTAIHRAFDLVKEAGGADLTLATVPAEDPAVYEMISRADTVGVFQIESRAQMSMLPRLRPACFYDLVIEVAIVRPGPIQGDMVHPYLRRRAGEEPATYPNDAIREVLEKTLGVPLFQEQAMRLAVVAAGFTPGEADQLRRAMGAWRRPGVIDEFHRRLVDGMLARGLSKQFAEQVFNQIRGFGEYGFSESHAASFALLVYVSAWLKCHHPAAFTAALLGSQPMGFYAPAQLVRDARAHGVTVLPADVNASGWHASLETRGKSHPWPFPTGSTTGPAIRLGLEQVHGLGEAVGRRIVEGRGDGPFRLPRDLVQRAGVDRESLLHLARAGALASLGLDRRRAVWEALAPQERAGRRPLFDGLDDDVDGDAIFLPPTTRQEEVIADYRSAGLSLEAHPLEFERDWLASIGVSPIEEAVAEPEGRRVRIAGIVLTRQRPATAKGLFFLTIEDETGPANVVVYPDVWEAAPPPARRATVLVVRGRIQRRGAVVHVLATQLEAAVPARSGGRGETAADAGAPAGSSRPLAALPRMSRDFC